jgi:acetoin utilization deacetylase AcuC-like enzyme
MLAICLRSFHNLLFHICSIWRYTVIVMKNVGFIYDDIFLKHETPKEHPENKDRLAAIIRVVNASRLAKKIKQVKPRIASFEEISLVHSTRYIDTVRALGTGWLDHDTYLSEFSLEAARYAAGAVMDAVDRCASGEMDGVFCAVRPPGHHADKRSAMGFCIFNNVAVGAQYARRNGTKKIFIIDFDAHHGNGIQHIFEEDNTVFYFSTHQFPHFPGTGSSDEKGTDIGEGYTRNITLPAGAGDAEFIHIYRDVLPPLVKSFSPDLILVSAGYDILASDPLSSLNVSLDGIRIIVRQILDCSPAPSIFVLEGGYNLEELGESVSITLSEMLK